MEATKDMNPERGVLLRAIAEAPTKRTGPQRTGEPPLFPGQEKPSKIPEAKKPLIQRLAKNLAVRAFLIASVLGGGGYAAYQEVPAVHEQVDNFLDRYGLKKADVPPIFDVSKLDSKRQLITEGVNARQPTADDMQSLINTPLPELKPEKTREDIPTISVLPSIDLQKAGKVEVYRANTPTVLGNIPINLCFSIENPDTPIGVIIPQGIGINVSEVEIFFDKRLSKTTDQSSGFITFFEKFDLGNKKYLIFEIISGNGLVPTDRTRNAPMVDANHPNRGNSLQDVLYGTGMKLNISENPTLFTTATPKQRIVTRLWYIDGNNGTVPFLSPQTQDKKLLIDKPTR